MCRGEWHRQSRVAGLAERCSASTPSCRQFHPTLPSNAGCPQMPACLPVRLQSGEWSEEQLLADQSLFHVRLAPMVEGSIWTSAAGDVAGAAPAAQPPTSDGDGGGESASEDDAPAEEQQGVEEAAHDATEL